MVALGLLMWNLARFRTSSFFAFSLTAAPTNATSLDRSKESLGAEFALDTNAVKEPAMDRRRQSLSSAMV